MKTIDSMIYINSIDYINSIHLKYEINEISINKK